VLGKALGAEDESPLVIAPDPPTIEPLVEVLDADTPSVRLLADADTLKAVMGEFLVAGRAADHVESGRLEIRSSDDGTNTLVVTGASVVSVVAADGRVAGLRTDDGAFVESAGDRFETAWERAEPYTLRTPSLARVRETLESELGEATAEDFDAVLSALEASGETGTELDEVTISLLVAARNEDLLYDISKWGEDVGIASKATFSRTKSWLEEAGLIETEKVPIDVGRPRLRLKLADDRLKGVETDEFVNTARSMLEA
jgi:hypothetical protein